MIAALVAELPALPLHTAGQYVAAAYVVLFALVLSYVAIMRVGQSRIERRPARERAAAVAEQEPTETESSVA